MIGLLGKDRRCTYRIDLFLNKLGYFFRITETQRSGACTQYTITCFINTLMLKEQKSMSLQNYSKSSFFFSTKFGTKNYAKLKNYEKLM